MGDAFIKLYGFQPYAYLMGTNPRAAFLARRKTRGWKALPRTRVGALDVNAGAWGAIRGAEVRLHIGMNRAPLFGYDVRALSRRLLRTRTRKAESNTPRSWADC